MGKNRFQYSRGPVDAVALLIVCAWLAIWVLWNRGQPEWHGRSISPTRIVYVTDPTGSALDDELIFIQRHDDPTARNGRDRIVGASVGLPRHPRLLDVPLVMNGRLPKLDRADLSEKAEASLTSFVPIWPETGTYRATVGQEGSFLVAMSQRLKDCGFELPINLFEGVDPEADSWQARVHLDCDINGRPRHVFLEEASQDAKINSWLVRTMYQGTMSITGTTCSGWITLGQRKQNSEKEE